LSLESRAKQVEPADEDEDAQDDGEKKPHAYHASDRPGVSGAAPGRAAAWSERVTLLGVEL
jgi:hypothetical protein